VARRPELKQEAAGAIAGRPELAGALPTEATVGGFPNRNRWQREEGEGITLPTSERLGKRPSCRAMAGGGKLLRRARPG